MTDVTTRTENSSGFRTTGSRLHKVAVLLQTPQPTGRHRAGPAFSAGLTYRFVVHLLGERVCTAAANGASMVRKYTCGKTAMGEA